jgi:hypothetical protein
MKYEEKVEICDDSTTTYKGLEKYKPGWLLEMTYSNAIIVQYALFSLANVWKHNFKILMDPSRTMPDKGQNVTMRT